MLIKNTVADCVLHYIGNSIYIIGKKDGLDELCVRLDCERGHVDYRYNDGFSIIPTINVAGRLGRDFPWKHPYVSYRTAVFDGGPVAIDIHGVGLVQNWHVTFYRIDHVVDGRAYRTLDRFRVKKPWLGPNALYDRFRFEGKPFRSRSASVWQPKLALGAKCV